MVYVDNMRRPLGRMLMSHMIADTRAELDAMAVALGIGPRFIQDEGKYREHYDICQRARGEAVALGAVEITQRELAFMLQGRRGVMSA